MADFPLGLSFDDVLLLPRLSAILPGDADISSQLVPGFDMKIPVLSAAMDTVSESELAIALAREGGLAVIHRNNPIDIQAAMVSRVKRFENAVIPNPVTVNKDMTLEEVHQIMMDQGYSGFPVVDANRKLEGIITGRDMRGVDDYQNVRVEDVMTPLPRLITAAPTTTIEEARHILYTHRIEKLPWWMNTVCWPASSRKRTSRSAPCLQTLPRTNTATCAAAPPWVWALIIWTAPKP